MQFSNGVDTYLYWHKNSQQSFDPHTTKQKVKVIIKKARRAKNEVGKRSKSKQLDKIETENGKPRKSNLNKLPLRALIRRISHDVMVSFPSNTNSGFSPWHYFASVTAEVRRSEDSMPKKLENNRFLFFSMTSFLQK